MVEIILDGEMMKNRESAHIYLKEKLEIPDYYGGNLDALWDILSSWSRPIEIKLINWEKLIDSLGDYGRLIIGVFQEATEENMNIRFTIVNEE